MKICEVLARSDRLKMCTKLEKQFDYAKDILASDKHWQRRILSVTYYQSRRFFYFFLDLGLRRGRKMTLRGVALDPQSISLVALMATRFVTDLMFFG